MSGLRRQRRTFIPHRFLFHAVRDQAIQSLRSYIKSYHPSATALIGCRKQADRSVTVLERNNVQITGNGPQTMMFAHGFGCDQNMWRLVAPAFEGDFKVVLFDHVGAGRSDLAAYDSDKYSDLAGYADDVVEILRELGLTDVVFVGHSVSAMIGVLASLKAPELFERLGIGWAIAAIHR